MKMMERMQTKMEESEKKMEIMVTALQNHTKEPKGKSSEQPHNEKGKDNAKEKPHNKKKEEAEKSVA